MLVLVVIFALFSNGSDDTSSTGGDDSESVLENGSDNNNDENGANGNNDSTENGNGEVVDDNAQEAPEGSIDSVAAQAREIMGELEANNQRMKTALESCDLEAILAESSLAEDLIRQALTLTANARIDNPSPELEEIAKEFDEQINISVGFSPEITACQQ